MAKIEIVHNEAEPEVASAECIEVRPWGIAGSNQQHFYIGSGLNFSARGNVWLEVSYTVGGGQLFYSRNYLHHAGDETSTPRLEESLEQFVRGDTDSFGFGDIFPETGIQLTRRKYTYEDLDGQEKAGASYGLDIALDVGPVFGGTGPGDRFISLQLKTISLEAGTAFMRDLIHEIDAVYRHRHPDPAQLPLGSSEWPFARQLYQRAYDIISQDYQENYFANPLLSEMFDTWLSAFPAGGHILDAGCGHGQPVIARLLDKGYRVTGTDISTKMLERARANFPGVTFVNQLVSELRFEAEFDGACSFSSLLYLDPIDLAHSLYRLYHALKPGGRLLLFAFDLHPDWRGLPYDRQINQWMWSWTYSPEEAQQALEEHGYFRVVQVQNVMTAEELEERIVRWRHRKLEEHEKYVKTLAPDAPVPPAPDLTEPPKNLAYCYAIIAERLERVGEARAVLT